MWQVSNDDNDLEILELRLAALASAAKNTRQGLEKDIETKDSSQDEEEDTNNQNFMLPASLTGMWSLKNFGDEKKKTSLNCL